MRSLLICSWVVSMAVSATSQVLLTMDRYACVGEPTSQTGVEVGLYGTMSNSGSSAVNLQCRLSTDQPEAWYPPGVCIGTACFPSDTDFPLALSPGASLVIHLSFYPIDVPGKGVYWLRYVGASRADSVRLEVLSGVPSLVVDDDEGGNAEHFLQRSLPQGSDFLTWDESLEPLALSDVALLERVMWVTGSAPGGCISAGEAEVLTALLQDGGRLLLSGQNALEGEAGEAFGGDELGTVVQATSVASRQIRGMAGTVFDAISFAISGGDGADNQTSPDALSPTGAALRALAYESGEIAAVGRIGVGGRRSLVCGFGVEACADSTVLEQSLDFFLKWLDGEVAGDDAPAQMPLMVRMSPNPSRGMITVDLGILDGSSVLVRLTDLTGRQIAALHDGPWYSRAMALPRLSPGTYVVHVRAGVAHAFQPLVVMEEIR